MNPHEVGLQPGDRVSLEYGKLGHRRYLRATVVKILRRNVRVKIDPPAGSEWRHGDMVRVVSAHRIVAARFSPVVAG